MKIMKNCGFCKKDLTLVDRDYQCNNCTITYSNGYTQSKFIVNYYENSDLYFSKWVALNDEYIISYTHWVPELSDNTTKDEWRVDVGKAWVGYLGSVDGTFKQPHVSNQSYLHFDFYIDFDLSNINKCINRIKLMTLFS